MSEIVIPGQGILFMKVGVHAREDLESIIQRKTKEIEDAGFALWGYGGNTCHPTSMVQPFAHEHAAQGKKIYLCMQEMNSKHFAEQLRAEQFSVDGAKWEPIPKAINVLGSRYALAIKALRREEFILPLNKAAVAVGNSKGRLGHRYIAGRVDKACLELADDAIALPEPDAPIVQINLIAELCEPYAVFLKS
jgi:hypothetical protein